MGKIETVSIEAAKILKKNKKKYVYDNTVDSRGIPTEETLNKTLKLTGKLKG